jgi:hypothetical protein
MILLHVLCGKRLRRAMPGRLTFPSLTNRHVGEHVAARQQAHPVRRAHAGVCRVPTTPRHRAFGVPVHGDHDASSTSLGTHAAAHTR